MPRAFDHGDLLPGTSVSVRHLVTEGDLDATAALTGDFNPIHSDSRVAREFGHSRRVAHGVFLLGLISRLIGTKLPGPGSIWYSSEVEFISPVRVGDEVEAVVTVEHLSYATNVVVMRVTVLRIPDKTVLRGKVRVKLPAQTARRERGMRLSDMAAIVTGGTRGIGEAIARKLAANGIRVVVSYKNSEENAQRVVSGIQASGGTAYAVKADIAARDDVEVLFERALSMLGTVDIIVNNATPPIITKPLLQTSAEEFGMYFNAYVIGALELVRMAVAGMRERKFGRVINILSSAINEVPPKMGAYITAKSALYGLSRAMAVEFGPWGINVNMVSPSAIITDRTDEMGVGAQESIARKIPLRRLGEPEEVADLVFFLVSESSSYISGANIPVTGGILQ